MTNSLCKTCKHCKKYNDDLYVCKFNPPVVVPVSTRRGEDGSISYSHKSMYPIVKPEDSACGKWEFTDRITDVV